MAYNKSFSDPSTTSEVHFQDIVENSRIIAETASDAIITIDERSTILFVNGATVSIFGYSAEEMLGSELTMLMPEYLRHLHRVGLKNYVETGHKHISWEAIELPGLHKDGREISLELSFGEFNKDGHRFFTGIARDITRRKRDERRLALQHSVAQILAEASTLDDAAPQLLETICANLDWHFAALWSVNPASKGLQLETVWRSPVSAGAAELETASLQPTYNPATGFPGQIMASKQPFWIKDFAREKFPRSPVAARGNLHTAFGFPIILGDQALGVIELFSEKTRDADGEMVHTLTAIASQIAQFIERKNGEQELISALARAHEARKEAERLNNRLTAVQRITDAALGHFSVDQVLAESLTRIREVLNVDTVAILLLESKGDGLFAWAAHGLEEEVETGVRIPVGKGFAGKVVAERKPIIIDDITTADVFNPLLRQKGIKSLLGVPLLVDGRATGVLHVGTLETHQFTAEDVRLLELAAVRIALAIENARLYEVEKTARDEAEAANQAKDEFLTILSHELRTPLTPIIGWVHIMQNGILPESDFTRALSVVNRNAYSLKRLINDLLDMSAILSGKMGIEKSPVSIGSVLEECLETMRPYAAEAKVQLQLTINAEPEALIVKGDGSRLNQAFCNILHNAIKFSPQNGVVLVRCEAVGTEVVIRFKDQGEGIPAKFLPHIFERFRQADSSRTRIYGGLGLGLSLVKSFVEAHHGTVEAISEGEGKGSTFVVKIPRYIIDDGATRRSRPEVDLETSKTAIRILVVEDQPDTLEMLTVSLRRRGYDVMGCDSAIEALQIAARERVDVLISDIGMPTVDGFQLIRDLRQTEAHKNILAIALTGYAARTDIEATHAAGFDLHLSKPIEPDDLAQAVEGLLMTRKA